MYLRRTTRRRKDGSEVGYLQLAHNEWDAKAGHSVVRVLYSFGREDRLDRRAERVLFAMVANRALEPLSKLAASKWVRERAWIAGLEELDEDACYRAMDWLLEVEHELAEAVYFATADLLNLEVDLLFFDTTSTYFERDEGEAELTDADGNVVRPAFRTYGKSKDHRDDLPQVVIGMAVTRTGIPIRVWCWPGNASDQELIRQVKDDLRSWKLARVVWVADRGFQSAENRRYLQRSGGHYILGEKLRGGSKEAAAALSRQGRYQTVAGNLRVKEVVIDDATMRDRFVVCHNPEEARR
ncbi:MAG: IS1634 family transposase, partial [Actinobacteria bacterium]|nr:IS1634 family transposase [Actinomycetota bacterium]